MLGLFSSRPDHPLADAKEAKRICGALLTREPEAALDEATALLESLARTEGFRIEQRLAAVLQLDEAAGVPARRLCRDYVTAQRLSRGQEFRLWQVNRAYWAALIGEYENCLERYAANEKAAESIKSSLGLLHARLLHAGANHLKWDQFRYGPADNRLWQRLGRIYLAAVGRRLAQQKLVLYAGLPETTVEAEYLRALVFQASSMDKLLPAGIEIAERLIANFLPRFVFTDQVRPDNVYWVDAARAQPPARLARPPEISPSLRFFNSIPAVAALQALKARIANDGRIPAEVNLGGQYPVATVIAVLDHLAACWSPTPPMRGHARHRVKSRLAVVHGLAGLHVRLQGRDDCLDCESWLVDDVSQGGLGALAPLIGASGAGDWLRIGALLGMRPEGGDNWLVGIVRRFSRDSDAQGAVGIETLSKTPRAIVADCGGLQTEGILLDALKPGESVRVVLPATAWEDGMSLLFPFDGAQARLFPEALLESGADTAIGRYFVQSLD